MANSATNNRRDYTFGRDFATMLLDSFDPNAVVFAHGDVDINTLFYHHFVEGMRPDIQLFTVQGLGMTPDGPRLFDPVTMAPAEKAQKIAQFAKTADRPIYFLGLALNSVSDIEYGLHRKVDRSRQGAAASSFAVHGPFVQLLRRVLADRPTDPWTIDHRSVVISQMAYMLTGAVDLGAGTNSAYRADLERVSGEFSGLLARVRLLESQGAPDQDRVRAMVVRARQLVDDTAKPVELESLRGLEQRLRLPVSTSGR